MQNMDNIDRMVTTGGHLTTQSANELTFDPND